jgi:hypothetical protein
MPKRIPTIIAIVLLLVGTAAGVLLVRRYRPLITQADPNLSPQQIQVTNIQDSGFTVSWTTANPASGYLNYGETTQAPLTAKDLRDSDIGQGQYTTHYIDISGLSPQRTYYFVVNSADHPFDNSGSPYQVTTAPFIETTKEPDIASGTILNPQNQPSPGSLVYLKTTEIFSPQSVLTDPEGNWSINLAAARSPDLSQPADYHLTQQQLSFSVIGPDQTSATALVSTGRDSPVPDIKLGSNLAYDWLSLPEQSPTETETSTAPLSQFQFYLPAQALESPSPDTLNLWSPQEDETLYTTSPLFLGQAPPNSSLIISIPPEVDSDTATADNRGNWQWSPSQPLTTGLKTAQITSTDQEGNQLNLTRSFTLLAQGELPAFTASPGATITPQPTGAGGLSPTPLPSPSPTPTLTPTPELSPTTSPSPTTLTVTPAPAPPEAGNLLPTFGLAGASLILIGAGLLLAL